MKRDSEGPITSIWPLERNILLGEVVQRLGYYSKTPNKLAMVPYHSWKRPEMLIFRQNGERLDSLNLVWKRPNTFWC